MRNYYPWITAAMVAGGAAGMASAQSAPAGTGQPAAPSLSSARTPEPAAQETLESAEDIAILKALAPLRLTRAQLSDLLPSLEGAQAKLAELDAKEAAKLAAWQGSLEQARRDLLAGKGNGARAGEQFALVEYAGAQKRASLRADMVASLRAALEKILTPAQTAQMAESGQGAMVAQRTAAWRGGAGRGTGGGPGGPATGGPAGPGGGGGGPGSRLDRIREMSPAEFEQFSQRQADRLGGQSSSQFQQYVTFMHQVRDMPPSQYVLQRDQLTAQSFGPGRGGFGAAGNNDDAIRAFVDRYLLSTRAPIVMRDRLRSP